MTFQLTIDALSHDARGVGRHQGKAVFVAGAIPGDVVSVRIERSFAQYDEAKLLEVVTASDDRVSPFCPLFASCGGCQLQHANVDAQRRWKGEHFTQALTKAMDTRRCEWVPPLVSADQGYRRRAHFFWGRDSGESQAKIGFRQAGSHRIVDVEMCPLLTPALNASLAQKRAQWLALGSRNVKKLTAVETPQGVIWSERVADEKKSKALSGQSEPTFSDSDVTSPSAYYVNDGLTFGFPPNGFVQVNETINTAMVEQAVNWLELTPESRVLDAFCGVGNFTLPIARRAAEAVGVEGDANLIEWARQNAKLNRIENAHFVVEDLFESFETSSWFYKQNYDCVLLDPGRLGAQRFSQQLGRLSPKVIVYVSCNAATLIRDVDALQTQGYSVTKAGFMDMFPHTSHLEVMVQLKRTKKTAISAKKSADKQRKTFRL